MLLIQIVAVMNFIVNMNNGRIKQ